MKMFRAQKVIPFVAILLASVCGCKCRQAINPTAIRDEVDMRELRDLEKADPKRDLQRAIEANDYRFIGIHGFTDWLPGVGDQAKPYSDLYGIRFIEGTSDAIINEDHQRLQKVAIEYAGAYNKSLEDYLKQQRPKRP